MATTKTLFKSPTSEKRWVSLQKEKAELQKKKSTVAIQKKIEVINSLMTSCKIGFTLSEAKVKKIIKFIQEKTGKDKIKYGNLPQYDGAEYNSCLYKDIVFIYVETDELVTFKEHQS